MSTGEIVASHWSPQGSLPVLMLGDHQSTIFSWCNLAMTPPGSGLDCGGADTSVPCLVDTHTRECQFLMLQGGVGCSVGCVTVHIGCHFIQGDVCHSLMHHLMKLVLSPVWNPLLLLKGINLHLDKITGFQIHGTYFSVIVPFLSLGFCHWLGLSFLESGLQSVMNSSHIFIHTVGRGASHGDLRAPKGREVKVNWEPWPVSKHNVDYTPLQWIGWHCRHALFQPDVMASQPFCLHPASWSFA